MARFMCVTLTLPDNVYKGPSGKRYLFSQSKFTKVDNPIDIEYFRKNSSRFVEEGSEQAETPMIKEAQKVSTEKSELEKFVDLRGIGDELAKYFITRFGTYISFLRNVNQDVLEEAPGIGKARARSIMKNIEKLKKKLEG